MDTVDPIDRLLAQLDELLVAERAAIAHFDIPALEQTAERKRGLTRELADALRGAPAERRRGLVRLRAEAEANALLLAEVFTVLAATLGVRRDLGTYDRRARLAAGVRSYLGGAM